MAWLRQPGQGWRGICLVAITYVYFLIFAQFAFLNRLAALGLADAHLKAVMAAMACGGVLFNLLTPRTKLLAPASTRMQGALVLCAAAALLTLSALTLPAAIAVSFLIGAGLGILTVTLATHLRSWVSTRHPLLDVGLGTGLGYFICNLPALFTASPQTQALTAAGLCIAGVVVAGQAKLTLAVMPSEMAAETSRSTPNFSYVLLCFTGLIWLDSAAFFIIQNTPALKSGTWEGSLHLWVNGGLHLTAALAGAWLLRRRGLSATLSLAVMALLCACLLLLDPHRALLASAFYPVGVSLYSVALVAYPSLLAPAASDEERGKRAGWIYAIAGWCGSAMGIGMGQHLGHVPALFALVATAAIVAPQLIQLVRSRSRELLTTAGVLAIAWCAWQPTAVTHASQLNLTPAERGRQVYISEGCINCHSQYVRPHTADELMWGPVEPVEEVRREHPPLIGNRRQGPDLTEVGTRRSALWLEAHFYDPAEVTHSSFMPSYAYLFRDGRGDDLIAYLEKLQAGDEQAHLQAEQSWHPSAAALAGADPASGARLFGEYCATCHAATGATRQRWMASLRRQPPDLVAGPFLHLPASDTAAQREMRLAQIIKFGLQGTDMPGHEYLPDQDVASLSLWLTRNFAQPTFNSQSISTNGENR
jgi:cytochrome c oxidase cbb3-type subunit 2